MTRWMSAFAAGVGSVPAAGAGGTKGVASGGGGAGGRGTGGRGAAPRGGPGGRGRAVRARRRGRGRARGGHGTGGRTGGGRLRRTAGAVEAVARLEVLLSRNRVFLSLQEALRLRREAARRREVRCA